MSTSFLASKRIARKQYKNLRNTSYVLARVETAIVPKPTGKIIIRGELRCCVDCSKAPLKVFFRPHFQPVDAPYKHNPGCASADNPKLK